MNQKLISKGHNGKIETAQIVTIYNGKSQTRHLWNIRGIWMDMWGGIYSL